MIFLLIKHHCNQKRRGSGNLTTHVLSSVDPGVHVLQIDLTPTDTSTSPKLVHALLIFLILNDSKTDRHNNTAMTQHTSPVLYFHTDAIQRKRSSCILFTEYTHPRRYKRFLQQIHKKEVWKFLGFLLLLCLAPQFFCNRSSTIRQTQRKITSTAKLPSTELLTMLPKISPPPLVQKTAFVILFFF